MLRIIRSGSNLIWASIKSLIARNIMISGKEGKGNCSNRRKMSSNGLGIDWKWFDDFAQRDARIIILNFKCTKWITPKQGASLRIDPCFRKVRTNILFRLPSQRNLPKSLYKTSHRCTMPAQGFWSLSRR